MSDINGYSAKELEALDFGGRKGGEYLEQIGKTDLKSLTRQEWDNFLKVVVGGFFEVMNELPVEGE